MKELLKSYSIKKEEIKSRLNQFKTLSQEEIFKEFQFCLLTPQSNAQRCWEAIKEIHITNSHKKDISSITNILKSKTRFHNMKAKRILESEKTFKQIFPLLSTEDKLSLRNEISKIVNGYGLKEASHFLRNIGHSNNQIAILDRHILRNLKSFNIIKEEKIKSQKHYLEIEKAYLKFANSLNIPADELDLLWWSQENGEIFK